VPGFEAVSTYEPRPAQVSLLGLPLHRGGGLTILEAPTGSGKTEAALGRFLRLFHADLVDGLYFALPTRTAATQMHARVRSAVTRAFPDKTRRPPVVLAVPGYLAVDDHTGTRLAPFTVHWPDEKSEQDRFRYWAAERPKRYLAGSIVVGTIDQVLLSSLMVRHAHMRAVCLLRHFLVVDEVHASDAYMNRILEDVVRRHMAAGGHALLMSATLGSQARGRFLATLGSSPPSPLALADAESTPYPALSHVAVGEEVPQGRILRGVETVAPTRDIAVELEAWCGDPDRIAARALSAALDAARVLVLRNTVADAMRTQRALEAAAKAKDAEHLLFRCCDRAAPHHARFARPDREALDRAIEHEFGKERPPGGCVAVATQTVQQSLDLDADLMLTDLCPMDVLLQRIGRLHRHARDTRPLACERARVIVLVPEDRGMGRWIERRGRARGPHGFGTVYEDLRILDATWTCLEAHARLRIPTMNRALVERSMHPEALAQVTLRKGDAWKQHAQHVEGVSRAKARLADLNLVDWSLHFGDTDCQFLSTELSKRVLTRLGEEDRRLAFDPPVNSPFGRQVRELILPAWQARDAAADAEPQNVVDGEGTIHFDFGGRSFVYDRLGLRPAEDGSDVPNAS